MNKYPRHTHYRTKGRKLRAVRHRLAKNWYWDVIHSLSANHPTSQGISCPEQAGVHRYVVGGEIDSNPRPLDSQSSVITTRLKVRQVRLVDYALIYTLYFTSRSTTHLCSLDIIIKMLIIVIINNTHIVYRN